MVALNTIRMADLSRQKRFETDLNGDDLRPTNRVGEAIDLYLRRQHIPGDGLRWSAFSRGVRLDSKTTLDELDGELDTDWTVIPEVSAG